MKTPSRITKDLFAPELLTEFDNKVDGTAGTLDWEQITNKPQLADSHWRSPVATVELLPMFGNNNEDVRLVLSTSEVYTWNIDAWELIGANDTNIEWTHVQNKPTSFPPSVHTHSYTTLTDVPLTFTPDAHNHTWSSVSDKPLTFPPDAHTHPDYLTAENISGLGGGDMVKATYDPDGDGIVVAAAYATVAGSADQVEWNDVDNKPSTYPPSAHSHSTADITSLSTYMDTNVIRYHVATTAPSNNKILWVDTN